ncbi:unnamed protein product [Sphagnum jensenii]|uniref:Uncharacterized protein n=1 Tax=Sphagnum jensenii TaxID=128206 RepID=A0ABP1B9N3_9BRYO
MLKKVFRKPKSVDTSSTLTTLNQLNEILEMLEKKEKLWQKKIAAEVTKAREYTQAKNKKAAIQCLKRKKLYEVQVEQLGNYQLRLHDQVIMLEGANATTETVAALRTGAMTMKALQKTTNIDDVDKTIDDINEQTESLKQIQDALSTPFDMGIDIDEDELEAELEELEELEEEEEVPQLVTTPDTKIPTHSPPPTQQVPARSTTQRTKEDDELESLQAEMAI